VSAPAASVDLLGVRVHAVDRKELIERVGAFVSGDRPATIGYANVHVLNTAARDPELRRFLNGLDLCYCDGNGVKWAAAATGQALTERMTGADWIWDLAAAAEGRWRIFWLGGEPGVTEAAAARLRERHPRLDIHTDHGFHEEAAPLLARINALQPDIVLVGMGTPVQERWVERWRGAIDAPVVWVLGATHDFVSGKVDRGPEWLHRDHEWLARLLVDPRRLWRRYLIGNVVFAGRVLGQRLRGEPRVPTSSAGRG
jgi:N-acetylglucosaminyldiphosphoundecaprenol N-acetyl-beta-D-mannosaminyltransferase